MFRALARRNLLATDDRLNVLVILGLVSADVIVYSQVVPLAVRSLVLERKANLCCAKNCSAPSSRPKPDSRSGRWAVSSFSRLAKELKAVRGKSRERPDHPIIVPHERRRAHRGPESLPAIRGG